MTTDMKKNDGGGAEGINHANHVATKEEDVGMQPTTSTAVSLIDDRFKNACVHMLLGIKILFMAAIIILSLTLSYQLLADKEEYKQLQDKYNNLVSANGTLGTDSYTTMILPHHARDVAAPSGGDDVMSTMAAMTSSFTSTTYFTNTNTVYVTVTSTPSVTSIPSAAMSSSSFSDLEDPSTFSATYCDGGSVSTVLVTVPATLSTGMDGSSETSTSTGIPEESTVSLTTLVVTRYTTETMLSNNLQTVITTMVLSTETSTVDGITASAGASTSALDGITASGSASSDFVSDGWVTPTPAAASSASSGPFTNSTDIQGTSYNNMTAVPASVSMFTVSWVLTVHPSGSGVGPSAGGAASASSLVPVVSKGTKNKPGGGPNADKGITGGYCIVMLVALVATILV